MPTIHVETDIEAPTTDVWAALTDFESYAEWNPVITSAEGSVKQNGRVHMHIEPTGGNARDWVMRITDLDPERRIEWEGTIVAPVIFRGRHAFELEPLETERTRVLTNGLFGGLVGRVIDVEETERDFEAVTDALRERVEAPSQTTTV